jgi:hypothetical protein
MNTKFAARFKPGLLLIFCFLYFFYGCTKEVIKNDEGSVFTYQPTEITPGIQLGEVYSTNNFSAFTDIVHYENAWYIVFRVGTAHLGGLNGQIKILKSEYGINWTVEKIITNDSLDLRDPKFILDTVNDELYINFFGTKNLPVNLDKYSVKNFIVTYNSTNGYSDPQEITDDKTGTENYAFWRYTYNKGKFYSAAYHIPILGGYATNDICLFNNNNDYKSYIAKGTLKLGSSPNEATIRFDANDNMYFLIRREVAHVALGFSTPSDYTKVTWLEDPLKIPLSSPNFLFYNGKLLICGRDQEDLSFKFFSYNLSTNKIEKKFKFPSGYETGYGGMSFNPANKDELWISYYSITSKKSYIYLAKMDLKTFLQ